ncbi:MAG TPA: HAD family hydrolase [Candidatus Paceibacterota bacterium]|nr:HAD family hydrolase [Candidatus Paceibacterota bacterium]
MIKHIWFDFSDTLARVNMDAHSNLRYATYAKIVGKPITPELIAEYEKLYEENNHSNSAIFKSLGMVAGFWSGLVNAMNPKTFYIINDPNIPQVLEELSKNIPVSMFSNINLGNILPALGINLNWFTHLLSSSMVGSPKPALDGYKKIIELSAISPDEILYVGDDIGKDVIPAKSVGIKAGVVFKKSAEADYSFKDFKDILEFIKSANH